MDVMDFLFWLENAGYCVRYSASGWSRIGRTEGIENWEISPVALAKDVTVRHSGGDMALILVVEDDETTRYLMARTLAAAGYEVAEAGDFRDALPILEGEGQVDLMLVDLVMPGVNGFALARMARLRRRDLKIVYVTGYDNVPVREARGPILRKPVMPDTLVAAVRNALSAAA
jgi:CheY-like chemotaxis protein